MVEISEQGYQIGDWKWTRLMGYYFKDYKKHLSGGFFFYETVHDGLYDILVWLRETCSNKFPNIILPVHIPITICDLVQKAGYEPRFYEILPDCQIDIDKVKGLIDDQTCAVMLRHYFGIPADVSAFHSHSVGNNVLLIEDCTQTLNSNWKGEELGSTGDCAIFNLKQLFQIPSGSIVVARNKLAHFKPRYSGQAWSTGTVFELFRIWGEHTYFHITRGEDPLGLANIRSRTDKKMQLKQQAFEIREIGWLKKICLNSQDINLMTQVRRANYEYLLNGIKDLAYVKPLIFSCTNMVLKRNGTLHLREGITPYSLPVLVPPEMRDLLVKVLAERGIKCKSEQMRQATGTKNLNRSEKLFRGLLELPIHQKMNRHQLDRIISCLHVCRQIEVM